MIIYSVILLCIFSGLMILDLEIKKVGSKNELTL